jgi:hypothetical protein
MNKQPIDHLHQATMNAIHNPGNTKKIDTLYVFMSIDENGNHGILSSIFLNLGSMPLVTGSENVIPIFQKIAGEIGQKTKMKVGMFEFKRGECKWQQS